MGCVCGAEQCSLVCSDTHARTTQSGPVQLIDTSNGNQRLRHVARINAQERSEHRRTQERTVDSGPSDD
jgi:hypothetical protein